MLFAQTLSSVLVTICPSNCSILVTVTGLAAIVEVIVTIYTLVTLLSLHQVFADTLTTPSVTILVSCTKWVAVARCAALWVGLLKVVVAIFTFTAP